jgi:hypothetical protein
MSVDRLREIASGYPVVAITHAVERAFRHHPPDDNPELCDTLAELVADWLAHPDTPEDLTPPLAPVVIAAIARNLSARAN